MTPICKALCYLAAFPHLVPSSPGGRTGRKAVSPAQREWLSASSAKAGDLSSDRPSGAFLYIYGSPRSVLCLQETHSQTIR